MNTPSHLTVLYRGKLSSCNYACDYCPFAKTYDSRAALDEDAADLLRFVDWVGEQPHAVSVLFTPWGEGLVRKHYREAMVRLSRLEHLRRVAIQTNLCVGLRWLDLADHRKLALWCTFHPSQVSRSAFVRRCMQLSRRGIRYSVGMVALQAHMDEIDMLRAEVPVEVPMWINAYDQRTADYYSEQQVERLQVLDPHFRYNLDPGDSKGAPCRTGEDVITVDGEGNVTRCHFVAEPLGNLYDQSYLAKLQPRACPNRCCDCFIGYVHRKDLPFQRDYAEGLLERIRLPRVSREMERFSTW